MEIKLLKVDLELFQTTKEDRKEFVSTIVNQVQNGNVDPLKLHLQLKSMEDIIKGFNADEQYKSLLLDAAEKHGKAFDYQSAKFQIKETGTKYDYSQCNDSQLAELEEMKAKLEEQIKKHQTFLKTLPLSGKTILNEETGEAVTMYPPSKSSTTGLAITLK